jgi:hypothetical protein
VRGRREDRAPAGTYGPRAAKKHAVVGLARHPVYRGQTKTVRDGTRLAVAMPSSLEGPAKRRTTCDYFSPILRAIASSASSPLCRPLTWL